MNEPSPLDHPLVSERAFHPRPQIAEPTDWISVGPCRLGCFVRTVDPRAGWVLYFHGNGELAAECDRHLADLFTDLGVNVCFAEYRGYGGSEGEPTLTGMLADGEQIVRALAVPADRIVAFGRSLGSVYAIELARRLPDLAGLVLESGIAELSALWRLEDRMRQIGRTAADLAGALARDFDHERKLAGYMGPVLVLHSEGDVLVEPWHARKLHAWAGGARKRLALLPHGNHNSILFANAAAYVSELRAFLTECGLPADSPSGGTAG